jgi:hypothetical protein
MVSGDFSYHLTHGSRLQLSGLPLNAPPGPSVSQEPPGILLSTEQGTRGGVVAAGSAALTPRDLPPWGRRIQFKFGMLDLTTFRLD